ncbi:anti-sigma F factor antagonist [Kroppenstedtia pulmonis]|uniref:Anti-sigma F factor antagonist n=1 Tax=Kroppenstedtia pulmonis TaxID=1380685 RepID=A0A7D4B2A5_9BACL|nr:anti-sigma F factor antagonist [Kroppenstedtia pulmonis]QKG84266.1 anti-sigma F factor antagonist [Kroppenstedtia pulmonis]
MSLLVDVSYHRNVLVVRLSGELDHHTAKSVRERLEGELYKGIYSDMVLNLSELTFMDSSGLGVILGRYRQVSEQGGKMILCSVHSSIYRLFELSGMFKILPLYENEQSALQACGVAS